MVALRRGTRVTVVATVIGAGLPLSAFADWSADVSRDAVGRLKVQIMADVDGSRTIYATCDTSRNTLLALLVPADDPSLSTTGMMLTFAFPDGRRWVSRAGLYRYDNDYIAVGYGNASDVPAIMAAVAGARDPIEVGLAAGSSPPQTWTADARGSTAAARKFLDNCFPTN
jgi:hypothetical protein